MSIERNNWELHEACKNGEIDKVKSELSREALAKFKAGCSPFGNTPLHLALSFKQNEIVEEILKFFDRSQMKELLEEKNYLKETPVHYAAGVGNKRALELMKQKCPECIALKGRFEETPLHSACGYGHLEVVVYLLGLSEGNDCLEEGSVKVSSKSFDYHVEYRGSYKGATTEKVQDQARDEEQLGVFDHEWTPLTRACHFGHYKIVKLLCDEGATVHHSSIQTAIDGMYSNCVEYLLFFKYYNRKNMLDHLLRKDESQMMTPFQQLIVYMPEVAKSVLYKCAEFQRFLIKHKDFEIKMHYDLIEYYKHKKMKKGKSDVPREDNHQKSMASDASSQVRNPLEIVLPHSAEPLLSEDDNMRTNMASYVSDASSQDPYAIENEDVLSSVPLLNKDNLHMASDVSASPKDPKISYEILNHPLSLMIEYDRIDLLTHPLVAEYIQRKWNSGFALMNILFLIFYIAFMFIWVITIIALLIQNNCYNQSGLPNDSLISNHSTAGNSVMHMHTMVTAVIMILIYSFIRFVLEMIQIYYSWRNKTLKLHFAEIENYIEIVLYLLASIFSVKLLVSGEEIQCRSSTWQLGAFVFWLSCIEFIFMSMQLNMIGPYALMFKKVLISSVKLIPFAITLIVAFGTTYLFLLQNEVTHIKVGYTFLKTFSMVFGGSYDGSVELNLHKEAKSTTIIWIFSVIMLTIILNNILVGLAVGEIKTIHNQANFEKYALQVKYILNAENMIKLVKSCLKTNRKFRTLIESDPSCSEDKSFWSEITGKKLKPNKSERNLATVYKWIIYNLWGTGEPFSQKSVLKLVSGTNDIERKIHNRMI